MRLRALPLLAALLLAASCRAPFEPTIDPPVVCHVPAAPVPVVARGHTYLVYEIEIVNRHVAPIRVTAVRSEDGRKELRGADLAAAMRESGRPRRDADPVAIAAYEEAVVFRFERRDDPPPWTLAHAVTFSGWPGEDDTFTLPASAVVDGTREPVVLAPPVHGGDWQVLNGFAPDSIHRRHVDPQEKRAYVAQRFAVDLVRVDGERRVRRDDGTDAEGYFAFDTPVLAPAGGVVVSAVDGLPDNEGGPRERAVEMTLANVPGNHVVLRLRDDGPFVLLAHLRRGSVRVSPGDRVAQGDEVGRIGSSGNSTEPHLHLHVSDGPDPTYADGLPFVFERFDIVRANPRDPESVTGARTGEIPVDGDVLRFGN